jgi:hypothetical protein
MTLMQRVPVVSGAFPLKVTFTVLDCASCTVVFAITDDLDARRRWDGGQFWCPNGHVNLYTSQEKKLQAELERAKQNAEALSKEVDWERTRAVAAERSRAATQGQLTKLQRRVTNGVCPCCKRSFSNVQRHMLNKHPDQVEHTG